MRRIFSSIGLLVAATVAASVVACRGDHASTDAKATPFSGEQLDRIDAGVRSQAPPAGAPDTPPADPRPLWVANELRDDGMRLVVHDRLPLRGSLDNLERHQAHCAHVRERMREFLLPGQRAELYLVFDDTVHAGRDEG